MACAKLLADIDQRVGHISAQVALGANKEEVVSEQYQALLTVFSMLHGVELDTISRVSNRLVAQDVFSRPQLLAFSVSLRAAAATRLGQPSQRPMQSNKALEHFLLQSDWDRLQELGQQSMQWSVQLEEIVAVRMHRLGMVCPDADTLKRASAIVQAVSGNRATETDSKRGVKCILIRHYPRSPFELPGEVLNHAYGEARPVNPPNNIGLKLIVAATPYKKMKANRLDQTPHRDQTSIQGATHAVDAIVPLLDASPPSTAQPPVMNAGPFAALMGAFMHGMHMGSQNRSKQSVASGASHTPEENRTRQR